MPTAHRHRLALGLLLLAVARPSPGQDGVKVRRPAAAEFKAVRFISNAEESTRRLNDLAADGWEYVGPLNDGLVAFKRDPVAAARKTAAVGLQGTWLTVETDWKSKAPAGGGGAGRGVNDKITFHGDRYTTKDRDGTVLQAGTFAIVDPAAEPKQIDFICTEGEQEGLRFRAVFNVVGGELRLCTDAGNNRRPNELSGKSGFLRVAKRDKE